MLEIITANNNLDEIVFEQRNKSYGAYDMRKRYKRNMTIALAISLTVFVGCIVYPYLMARANAKKGDLGEKNVVVILEPIHQTENTPPPPPPPPVKTEALLDKAAFTQPQVVDTVLDDKLSLKSFEDLMKGNVATDENYDSKGIFVEVSRPIEIEENNDPLETFQIDEQPEFPGGEAALRTFLGGNVVYPAAARENNIQGKVFVHFVVTRTGAIDKVSLLRGVDPLLDEEAMRVVKTLPKWKPGKQNGTPVNVWFTVPINFTLQN